MSHPALHYMHFLFSGVSLVISRNLTRNSALQYHRKVYIAKPRLKGEVDFAPKKTERFSAFRSSVSVVLIHTCELSAPGICPAFAVKLTVSYVILLSVASEAVTPDN